MTTALGDGLRRVAAKLAPDDAPDGELLARFLAARDEAAFAVVVRRHGAMVLGTCRRVLGNAADADDAFQAAFVVLARRAAGFTGRASVGNFLYGVACHTARKAKAMAAKRRLREAKAERPPAPADDSDLLRALDEELARLPEKYRGPVVLCELEGQSRRDAAASLGVPEGTMSSRLATAHRMLQKRLQARGFAVAGLAALLADRTATASPGLAAAAVQAALTGPTGGVLELVAEVSKMLFLSKLKLGAAVVAGVAVLMAAGAGGVHLATADEKPAAKPERKPEAVPDAKPKADPPKPAAAEVPAWQKDFYAAYALKEGEVVKRIAPPFPESRLEFLKKYDFLRPEQRERNVFTYWFDGKKIEMEGMSGNSREAAAPGSTLHFLLWSGGAIPMQEVECPGELLTWAPPGEFVVRKGAKVEEFIPAVEKLLRGDLGWGIRLRVEHLERDVLVATGQFASKPLSGRKEYDVEFNADQRLSADTTFSAQGKFDEFLTRMGEYVGTRVVNEVPNPPGKVIRWHYLSDLSTPKAPGAGPAARESKPDPEGVLKSVSAQTGLTFERAKRKVRVISITEDKK